MESCAEKLRRTGLCLCKRPHRKQHAEYDASQEQRYDSIKLRTMTDMVEREGSKIIGDMREYGNRILKEHGWNLKTGLPEENAFIEPGIPAKDGNSFANRRSEEDERKHREEIDALAESINQRLRKKGLKIPDNQALKYDIETDSSGGAVILRSKEFCAYSNNHM